MLPALAMAGPVSVWMILFVTIPMLYIIYISFMSRGVFGDVVYKFSTESYKTILNPTYFLVSSGLGCLRLAVSKRGVCLIESCLGSSGLGLGGIEVLLEGLDVDSAERVLRGVVCRLRGGGAGLSLLVLALGGVHVRVGCGIGVLCAFLIIESSEICRIGRAQRLLRLGELALELLELRLLRLRAASVIGRIDVVVDELLELGNSRRELMWQR